MSLRARLALLILALVAVVAISLSAMQLQTVVESLTSNASERADLAAQQVSSFLLAQVAQNEADYPPEQTVVQVWNQIASNDPYIKTNNEVALTLSPALVEISIADGQGIVLTSTTKERVGQALKHYERLSVWMAKPWYERAYDLVQRSQSWEVIPNPLGIPGSSDPVFNMQVVVSPVLLKPQLMPQIQRLLLVLGISIALALLITFVILHQAMRPLQRIERTIDRIAQGSFAGAEKDEMAAKEFKAVESKLAMLGQQMREVMDSARESPHRLDVFVERMASQLDVASRLAAISKLSGGVAHEIKNPLNAILLRIDLLKARLGDSDPELAPELDVLSKEVLRLDRVVKTFLDFSRPVEVHFEDVDIAAVVREVAELLKPQAALAKIDITYQVPAESGAMKAESGAFRAESAAFKAESGAFKAESGAFKAESGAFKAESGAFKAMMRGDPDLLKQAVINLVTNAIEAMANGGTLRCSVAQGEGTWIVEVADNGPGIPPERRDRVFQLYFTTKNKGSGIGLAMTYRAVQLHNGVIGFTSESGKGTTFRMEFPANLQHA